jgi:hypothetical protein
MLEFKNRRNSRSSVLFQFPTKHPTITLGKKNDTTINAVAVIVLIVFFASLCV